MAQSVNSAASSGKGSGTMGDKLQPHGLGGDVTRQSTVWCCTCEHWNQQDGAGTAAWRAAGWRKTKHGWQCPACRQPEKDESE